MTEQEEHTCERCGKPATDCYREGSGTGHSEHVCACSDHGRNPIVVLSEMLRPRR